MSKGRSGRPRGEVAEICKALDHLSTLNGAKPDVIQLKRDCFQKLIRYMTQGIDMSGAFVPVTKCVALSKSDLPLKKMQYLYLRTTARQNSSVALLVVQTLLNDCRDLDPTIRGAALRSMASLRVPDLMDTVFMSVEKGLKDPHHYVREAAVMGVLKCWHADPSGTRLRGLLSTVESILTADADAQVVANCLHVMQEVNALRVTRELVISLLNHIRLFSDWSQCLVLEIVGQYGPASEAERFDILEVLDFGLSHANSAVVMATAKLFLQYTAGFPAQARQVLGSVRDALLTLVTGREHEVVYAALSNVLVLAQRHPEAFTPLYTDFYCRYHDPSYLKALKVDMLVAVTDPGNAYEIAEELSQYIRDADEALARRAIRAVAAIALKVPEVTGILDRLLLFLGLDKDYVTAETLVQMAVVLRRFPDAADACIDTIVDVDPVTLEGPEERAAYVWVLGEYGDRIQAAPYLLESLVNEFEGEAAGVKLALLAALPKLFFRRAPECKPALGAALAAGARDSDVEVRDAALFALRLLRHDVHAAREVLAAPLPAITNAEEELSPEVQDRIFDELNTLSVVYRVPAFTFIDPTTARIGEYDSEAGGSEAGEGGDGGGADATGLLLDLDARSEETASVGAAPSPSQGGSTADLLSLGGVGNGGGGGDLLVGLGFSAVAAMSPASTREARPPQGGGWADLLGGLDLAGGPDPAASPGFAPQPPSRADDGLADLLGGLGLGGGGTAPPPRQAASHAPVTSPAAFGQRWSELAHSSLSAQQDLPLGVLSSVQGRGFQDFGAHMAQAGLAVVSHPSPGTGPPYAFQLSASNGVLAQVGLTTPSTAVHVRVEVRGGEGSRALGETLETLQNLLLCL